MSKCRICDMPDEKKPMCFRATDWCSDFHRKMIIGELPPPEKDKPDDNSTTQNK